MFNDDFDKDFQDAERTINVMHRIVIIMSTFWIFVISALICGGVYTVYRVLAYIGIW